MFIFCWLCFQLSPLIFIVCLVFIVSMSVFAVVRSVINKALLIVMCMLLKCSLFLYLHVSKELMFSCFRACLDIVLQVSLPAVTPRA